MEPQADVGRIEGIVVNRKQGGGVLRFDCDVAGEVVACIDATRTMSGFAVMVGQKLSCEGRWSPAVRGLFEVSRIEKLP